MRLKKYIFTLILSGIAGIVCAQGPLGYEKQYDEPYGINKLWVHFQPLYGEVSASNTTLGFGIEADYMHQDKFDINLHGRLPYSQRSDLARDAAAKNADNTNQPTGYAFFELGGNYHWKDIEVEKESKVYLYRRALKKNNRWASNVIKTTKIKNRLRKIYGARAGFWFYNTSFDMSRILEKQGVQLTDVNGEPIPDDLTLFGNQQVIGFNVGASIGTIRNFAVNFERTYDPGGDDLIFDAFFDIMIAPSIGIDNIIYNGNTYTTDNVKTSSFGFRLGIDGKFNRKLGYAYGFETGIRPAVQGGGFFAMLKLSFPVYSTNLESSKVESEEQGAAVDQ